MAITRTLVALVLAGAVAVIASAGLRAQAGAAAVPFKLGTFEQGGRTFVGLVLRDTQIAGIALSRRATLATRNTRHFQDLRVPVVDPWQEHAR